MITDEQKLILKYMRLGWSLLESMDGQTFYLVHSLNKKAKVESIDHDMFESLIRRGFLVEGEKAKNGRQVWRYNNVYKD